MPLCLLGADLAAADGSCLQCPGLPDQARLCQLLLQLLGQSWGSWPAVGGPCMTPKYIATPCCSGSDSMLLECKRTNPNFVTNCATCSTLIATWVAQGLHCSEIWHSLRCRCPVWHMQSAFFFSEWKTLSRLAAWGKQGRFFRTY